MKEICSITHHGQFMCKSSCAKVHDTFPGTSQELFMNSSWWLEMVIKFHMLSQYTFLLFRDNEIIYIYPPQILFADFAI